MMVRNASGSRRHARSIDHLGDLGCHAFLDLQALCERVHNARQLRNTDDSPVGYVSYVGTTNDGCNVMLAVRLEADVAEHDHLVVARDLLKAAAQQQVGVFGIAGESLLIGAHDARGRIAQASATRIIASPSDQGAHCVLGFRPRGFVLSRRRAVSGPGCKGLCRTSKVVALRFSAPSIGCPERQKVPLVREPLAALDYRMLKVNAKEAGYERSKA
jgi:hypothetical protein